MHQLTEIIRGASAAISAEYFLLRIDGGPPVYRERVYCYELYHQMRLRWPQDSPYLLNGEVDKRAHPYFKALNADERKPDLLVHQPGVGQYNHAVIEVKSVTGEEIGKDLETLSFFRNTLRYERAILLIYGAEANDQLARVQKRAAEVRQLAPIEVWLHPTPTAPAALSHILTPR